ncbi:hypothetical protein TYRP_002090 [Tyrophagus putrescentiae]|nr:hypothetical protein TYRP_002090 [Tyrophagus putrescentiae]
MPRLRIARDSSPCCVLVVRKRRKLAWARTETSSPSTEPFSLITSAPSLPSSKLFRRSSTEALSAVQQLAIGGNLLEVLQLGVQFDHLLVAVGHGQNAIFDLLQIDGKIFLLKAAEQVVGVHFRVDIEDVQPLSAQIGQHLHDEGLSRAGRPDENGHPVHLNALQHRLNHLFVRLKEKAQMLLVPEAGHSLADGVAKLNATLLHIVGNLSGVLATGVQSLEDRLRGEVQLIEENPGGVTRLQRLQQRPVAEGEPAGAVLPLHRQITAKEVGNVRLLGEVDANERVTGDGGQCLHQRGLPHARRPFQQYGLVELQRSHDAKQIHLHTGTLPEVV